MACVLPERLQRPLSSGSKAASREKQSRAPDVPLKLLAARPAEDGRPVNSVRRKNDVDPPSEAARAAVLGKAEDDERLLERNLLASADLIARDGVQDDAWRSAQKLAREALRLKIRAAARTEIGQALNERVEYVSINKSLVIWMSCERYEGSARAGNGARARRHSLTTRSTSPDIFLPRR